MAVVVSIEVEDAVVPVEELVEEVATEVRSVLALEVDDTCRVFSRRRGALRFGRRIERNFVLGIVRGGWRDWANDFGTVRTRRKLEYSNDVTGTMAMNEKSASDWSVH